MSRTLPPRSYPELSNLLQPPRSETPPAAAPRRAARERVLVVRGYSPRWPRLSRIAWWLRLLPARLAVG